MGIASDLMRRSEGGAIDNRSLSYSDWVQKMWGYDSGTQTYTGKTIDEKNALNITAVFAAIRILSENIASLPIHLYRREEKGRTKAVNHPLYSILHSKPNPEMTSMVYRETCAGHLVGWGNSYSNIEYNRAGRVKALWPLTPDRMEVTRLRGELAYLYQLPSGEERALKRREVLHIPGLSFNGINGYSPIAKARQALGAAVAMEEHGARFFGNSARPDFLLVHPETMDQEAQDRFRDAWEKAHKGLDKSHRVAILEQGIDVKTIGISPKDSMWIEGRKFSVIEICRIFNISPHLLKDLDRATFSNIIELSQEFVKYTLRPWLIRIEQCYNNQLLSDKDFSKLYFEHLVDALLRGDEEARWRAYRESFMIGGSSINGILALENRNPVEGKGKEYADEHFVPLNMVPLSQIGQQAELDAETEKTIAEGKAEAEKEKSKTETEGKVKGEETKAQASRDIAETEAKKEIEIAGFEKAKEIELAEINHKAEAEKEKLRNEFEERIKNKALTTERENQKLELEKEQLKVKQTKIENEAKVECEKIRAKAETEIAKIDYKKEELRVQQSHQEQKSEQRKLPIGRNRVKASYKRLFLQAAEVVVYKETIALRRAIKKHLGERNISSFEDWLEEFYGGLPKYIKRNFLPVIRSFAEAIQAEAAKEIGGEIGLTPELEKFIDDYMDNYSYRHIESSLGQLTALIKDTSPDELQDTLEQRTDEWGEKRAEKIATNETAREGEGITAQVFLAAGFSLVWRTSSKKPCPFCSNLNGKVIGRGQVFVPGGTNLKVEGQESPMKIRTPRLHPPLHQSPTCQCYIDHS